MGACMGALSSRRELLATAFLGVLVELISRPVNLFGELVRDVR